MQIYLFPYGNIYRVRSSLQAVQKLTDCAIGRFRKRGWHAIREQLMQLPASHNCLLANQVPQTASWMLHFHHMHAVQHICGVAHVERIFGTCTPFGTILQDQTFLKTVLLLSMVSVQHLITYKFVLHD